MRLPAIGEDEDPALDELVARIKAERGSLLTLYRVLLNSPPIAEGWLALFTAIRNKSDLDGRARELVILRVAALNRARYEFDVHAPIAVACGIPQECIEPLRRGELPDLLTERDRLVVRLTDAMTRDIEVPEQLHTELKQSFGARNYLELVVTAAGYNMVSRVLVALEIEHETGAKH